MPEELTLEQRLTALEKEVVGLKLQLDQLTTAKTNWIEQIVGSLEGYPEFGEVIRLGAEFRRSQQPPGTPEWSHREKTMSEELAIEQRLAALEKEVSQLRHRLEQVTGEKANWLEKVSGCMASNPAFEEAMRLGAEIRGADRPADKP